MRTSATLIVFLSAGLASAQSPPPPDPYHNEPLVLEHYDTAVHMRADGTGDRTLHVTVRLQSEGAVRQFSVISVGFASANETGSIDYVRVHKPDGTTVETPVADAIEMPAPVTSTAPLYSDLKDKQLPVRSLATGDVLDYQLRTVRTKAEAPGQFWGVDHFLKEAGVILSQTLTLEVPVGTYLQVWDPNHPTTPKQHDGVVTYVWTASQLTPTPNPSTAQKIKDPDEDAEGRKIPSVAWTTFHSWADVGNWYRGLAFSRSEPVPAIVSRANELTKDAKTPEEQVRALYDFVSARIRYVGIDFGIGRYQPHLAQEVLIDQYGDCKDKDTLLEALLRAKGFTTAPALIGVGIAPVPGLPSPAFFNHVITTVDLPGGRIWLDSTPEVAPYRVLVPFIRDQQALVIPPTGTATLERTPANPPYPYLERFEAVGTLDKDGLLKSHMDMTLRSDNELGFRLLVARAAPAQWDEAMQSVSRAMGFAGTVSNADLRQKDPSAPVHLSYDYSRPSYADWDNHRILPLFPSLEITYIDKEKAPEHDIDQGAPRKLEAVTHIKLPAGYKAALLDGVHVKRDYATFDQTYRTDNGELIIERTVVILKQKVPKEDWKDYYAYTKAIGAESGENYISLNLAGTEQSSPEAIARIRTELNQGKWQLVRLLIDEALDEDPNAPTVMAMLGDLDQQEGNLDQAIKDYETELKNHPDAPSTTVTALASAYTTRKRYDDAETILRKYLNRNEPTLSIALADTLHRVHRDQEAAAIIKTALPQSKDPTSLNNGAYLLSEMELEFPLAEASARRAIQILEAEQTHLDVQKANDGSYRQAILLTGSWDTLGWILFQQGRPAEAEPYIRAAWLYHPEVTAGNHLAQVLDALGKRSESLAISEQALASDGVFDNPEDCAEIRKNLEHLRRAGANDSGRDGAETASAGPHLPHSQTRSALRFRHLQDCNCRGPY